MHNVDSPASHSRTKMVGHLLSKNPDIQIPYGAVSRIRIDKVSLSWVTLESLFSQRELEQGHVEEGQIIAISGYFLYFVYNIWTFSVSPGEIQINTSA